MKRAHRSDSLCGVPPSNSMKGCSSTMCPHVNLCSEYMSTTSLRQRSILHSLLGLDLAFNVTDGKLEMEHRSANLLTAVSIQFLHDISEDVGHISLVAARGQRRIRSAWYSSHEALVWIASPLLLRLEYLALPVLLLFCRKVVEQSSHDLLSITDVVAFSEFVVHTIWMSPRPQRGCCWSSTFHSCQQRVSLLRLSSGGYRLSGFVELLLVVAEPVLDRL